MIKFVEIPSVTSNNERLAVALSEQIEAIQSAGRRSGLYGVFYAIASIAVNTLDVQISTLVDPNGEVRTEKGGTRRYQIIEVVMDNVMPQVLAVIEVNFEYKTKEQKSRLPSYLEVFAQLLKTEFARYDKEKKELFNLGVK